MRAQAPSSPSSENQAWASSCQHPKRELTA